MKELSGLFKLVALLLICSKYDYRCQTNYGDAICRFFKSATLLKENTAKFFAIFVSYVTYSLL